jgi:2-polyprenyl-3-methyl-5-hydroxy-6-metoxy-1,4-benzoquinol methylase
VNYSLEQAKKYWQYAPNSLESTKTTSNEFLNRSDADLKRLVLRSIEARNNKEGAMEYRTRVLGFIVQKKVRSYLDFGCGVGQDGVYFAVKCPHLLEVTFADIVESNVKLVSNYARIFGIRSKSLLIESPENQSLPETYDMIFANGVLHHTPRARQIVLNLKRHLRSNGLFVCMLYTPEHFRSRHVRNLREYAFLSEGRLPRSAETVFNPYSDFYDEAKARKLFEGFELLDHFMTHQKKFGWYVLTPSHLRH